MLTAIKEFYTRQRIKGSMKLFLDEMERNLESYYVMQQRQFITEGFLVKTWESVKDEDLVKRHPAIVTYAERLIRFNKALKEHKAYEQWYASDMKNKTPDNARTLHGMKNDLDEQLKGMEAVIILAGQALEKDMLDMGLIKL